MMDDEHFLNGFSLPNFSVLAAEAAGRQETVHDSLVGGSALQTTAGLVGLNIGVGRRQTGYWLPADHPNYNMLQQRVSALVGTAIITSVTLDPVNYIIFDVAETT